MKRRKYTTEFKREAARMMIMDGQTAGEVSAQLGVNTNQLYRWKREHLEGLEASTTPNHGSPTEMAAEIDRLRKELARSGRINEILKKTVGYFAKDES
jgi:transposase